MTDHEKRMQQAMELALKGVGKVNPNPLVGAIITKDDEIIGQGYHEAYGKLHAERYAIENCTKPLKGATLYVTLEPCCHYGKTPPCTDAIIESGISRVIVACLDPNPLVAGKGIEILEKNGIEVITGILEKECEEMNEVFFHYIKNKTPFVVMKYAMTMDGKIATKTGESRWITGELARKKVHEDRNRYMAIMVGVGTVIADNPLLNCRIPNGRDPVRIICDTNLRMPLTSQIVATAKEVRTIVATSVTDKKKQKQFIDAGIELIIVSKKNDSIDLSRLMFLLGERGIDSILLEGGSALNFNALRENIVQKVHTYIAPKIFGGKNAKTPVAGDGISDINDCICLENPVYHIIGNDFYIESEVKQKCSQEL